MGDRGPAPTPTKLLAPDSPRHRWRSGEPRPAEGEPERPDWLSGQAAEAWPAFVAALPPGVLTDADGHALGAMCERFASWRRNVAKTAETGEGILQEKKAVKRVKRQTEDGEIEQVDVEIVTGRYFTYFPWATAAREDERLLMQWLGRFGLTPADRSRISIEQPGGEGGAVAKLLKTVG